MDNTFRNITQGAAQLALYGYDQNVSIIGNVFASSSITASYIQESDTITFEGNQVYQKDGVAAVNFVDVINSHDIQVTGNTFRGPLNNGGFGSSDVRVYDNAGTFGGHRGLTPNSYSIAITNNKFINHYYGVIIPAFSGSDKNVAQKDITIEGNTFTGGNYQAIHIGAASTTGMARIHILNNIASSSHIFDDTGLISIVGSSTAQTNLSDIEIGNNYTAPSLSGGNSAGIYVDGASNVRMFNNTTAGTGKGTFSDIQVTVNTSNVFYQSITSTGFGIGTSTPWLPFSVFGDSIFKGYVTLRNDDESLTLQRDDNNNAGSVDYVPAGTISATNIHWSTGLVADGNTNNWAIDRYDGASDTYPFVVANSSNVGIGSSTPGTMLSVGTVNGINFNPSATSTFGTSANGINLNAGCFAIRGTCIGGSSGGVGNWFTPQTYGNSTSTLVAFLSGFMVNAASSTITGALNITGQTTLSSKIYSNQSGDQFQFQGNSAGLQSTNGNIDFYTGFTGKQFYLLNSSSAQTFLVNFDSGQTGLGTSTPASAFELAVQGNGLFSGNVSMAALTATGTAYFAGNVGTGDSSAPNKLTVADGNIPLTTNDSGNLYIYTTDSAAIDKGGELTFGGSYTGTTRYSFGSVSGRKLNNTGGSSSGYLAFSTTNAGFAGERMRIDNAGNLGIGTTSPSQVLSVQGNSLFSGDLSLANLIATGTIKAASGAVGSPSLTFSADSTTGFWLNGANTLDMSVGGNKQWEFGIGSFYSNNGGGPLFLNADGASKTTPIIIVDRADTTTGFAAGTSGNINAIISGVEKTRWTSTGFGIGSSSPFASLSIHATNGDTNKVLFAIGSSTATATTSLFTVSNTGVVGIGTDKPTLVNANAKLTVAGTGSQDIIASTTDDNTLSDAIFNAYADSSRVFMGAHGENQVTSRYGITLGGWAEIGAFANGANTNGLIIGTNPAAPIVFGTNNVERMRILSGGNVGVGTTSPFAQLSVMAGGTYSSQALSTVFAVGSTTAGTATSTLFSINSAGTIQTSLGSGLVGNNNGLLYNFATSSLFGYIPPPFPFTPTTYNGINVNSTTTPLFVTNAASGFGLIASSTFVTYASSTQLTTTGTTYLATLGGNVGVGTTTPWATFSAVGNGTDPIFAIATSTNTGLPNFEIDKLGHIMVSGAQASLSAGTFMSKGNDTAGIIKTASGAGTTFTLTFAKAYTSAPACVATFATTTAAIAASSTLTTVVFAYASVNNVVLSYHCMGVQ